MTRGRVSLVATALVAVVTASGCTQTVAGSGRFDVPRQRVADAKVAIEGLPGGRPTAVDTIAGNAIADIQRYWKAEFPAVFDGRRYAPPKGGFYSVDPDAAGAVPCVRSAADIRGNAFYCPSRDVVAWDRVQLLPQLEQRYGTFLVAMVLAHEWGHVIQAKSGVDPDRTIVAETQADCYAGGWTRWALEGQAPHFPLQRHELDQALAGYLQFRDPVGASAGDEDAHGNGFDRISAFQEGFEQGPGHCAGFDDSRTFTETGFTSSADRDRGGNLPLDDTRTANGTAEGAISLGARDLELTWPKLYPQIFSGSVRAPTITEMTARGQRCGTSQITRAVYYCASDDTIYFDRQALHTVSAKIGGSDYAPMTLLGIAFGQAMAHQAGLDTGGADGVRRAICLDGAYTRVVTDRTMNTATRDQLVLSPGDLDEAIQALLSFAGEPEFFGDQAAAAAGFDRVQAFRQGFTDAGSCR